MTPTYLSSSSPSPFPPAEYPNGLHQADNFDSHGGSYYDIGSTSDNRLKFSIWKKEEDKYENYHHPRHRLESTSTSTSSKMRLMHKMENNIDPTAVNPPPSATTVLIKLEDHQIKDQVLSSSPMKTDNSSNTANPSNNSTNPIRVFSDCNTTKTPLWRSGPQGPKSLCNACGIRQRKARRAMAEAAATDGTSLEIETTLGLKTKIKKEQKEKGPSNSTTGRHNVGKYKIRRRSKLITSTGPTSSSHDHHQGRINKICF